MSYTRDHKITVRVTEEMFQRILAAKRDDKSMFGRLNLSAWVRGVLLDKVRAIEALVKLDKLNAELDKSLGRSKKAPKKRGT